MIYLSSFLFVVGLFFIESSILPQFMPHSLTPLLILPFLSVVVLRDRTLFPIILAGISGIITDAIAGNIIPIYSIAYVLVVFISKIFFARFISYGEIRANIINVTMGIIIIYGLEIALTINNINKLNWLFPLFISIGLTFIILFIYIILGRKYFSWIEKESEERFR